MVQGPRFESIATKLTGVSAHTLQAVASHIEKEGHVQDLSAPELAALDLLKEVNTISAWIPGSQSYKVYCRNEI